MAFKHVWTGFSASAFCALMGSVQAQAQTVDLPGGTIGDTVSTGTVNLLSGGQIVAPVTFNGDAMLNVSGGTVVNVPVPGSVSFVFGLIVSGDAQASVTGGSLADSLRVQENASLDLSGGVIGNNAHFGDAAQITLNNGQVGDFLRIVEEADVNFSAGTIGDGAQIGGDATVQMTGGVFGSGLTVFNRGVLTQSGGILASDIDILDEGVLNLMGTGFEVDGVAVNGLVAGNAFEVAQRSGERLTGFLADGSAFSLQLNSIADDDSLVPGLSEIANTAKVNVIVVPEPVSLFTLFGFGSMYLFARRRRIA